MAARRIRGVRLTREERLEVRRLIATGSSFEQAALVARCSTKTVQRLLGSVGGMPARQRVRAKLRLSLAEREETLQYISRRHGSLERAPVVYIHGGGWVSGKKELYTSGLYFLAEAGHPVFNLEYPLAPANPHPGILLSLLRAVAWIRSHHPEFDAVHFMGDSAGGNLAMMMGILMRNPERVLDLDSAAASEAPIGCHSVVSLYGVLDRLSWLKNEFRGSSLMLECYGGKAAFAQEVGPDLVLTPMDANVDHHPPSLLIAGTDDPLCESSQLYAANLRERGRVVVHKEFEGERHGFFNWSWRPAAQQVRRDILDFLSC